MDVTFTVTPFLHFHWDQQQFPDHIKMTMWIHFSRLGLLGLLLTGCSAHLLEDLGEVAPPRPCTDTVKLFDTFSMRATGIAWKGTKGTTPATLTVDLVFYNDKNFPIALSNSGSGMYYTVAFNLQGKTGVVTPKEASGVALVREGKKFKEPASPGPSGAKPRRKMYHEPAAGPPEQDANFRIKPGEPQGGKLVFQLPRDSYVLTIERRLADKRPAGQPKDYVTMCTIPENDVAGQHAPGMSGVY